ncbi:hypothetical protein NQ317_006607 [Molorchus minor]|uniref:Uncharacterized protein n=1 Tax=Molorchus minor TaxID=1323400 RepID=A0ABQ9K0A9_9CUCU|nr:hypothetical protein NQ317_006607 [Molorchus minor]
MASKFVCVLACALGVVSLVHYQNFVLFLALAQELRCYDCDPRNYASDCVNPIENSVPTAICNPDNGTSICLSAYLTYSGQLNNETGIHRGCANLRQGVADFFEWYREENNSQNLTVTSCVSCNSTRCNTIMLNSDGSSGTNSVSSMVFVLIINAAFVVLVNSF